LSAHVRAGRCGHAKWRSLPTRRQIMPGDSLRAGKHSIEPLGSKLIGCYVRFVANLQLLGGLCRDFFVTKENDLHIPMQPCPALQRIPLDDPIVPSGGFRCSKKRELGVPALPFRASSLLQLLPLGRDDLFENPVQAARDFPVGIIPLEFSEVRDVTDVVALASILDILPR